MIIRKILESFRKILPLQIENLIVVLFYKGMQYNEDGIITMHVPGFRKQRKFFEAKQIAKRETEYGGDIDWRLHTVLWAAEHCSDLEGDFIECGVDTGFLMRSVIEYVNFGNLKKNMYLMDTFEGIPQEYVTDDEKKINYQTYNNKYSGKYDKVIRLFGKYNNVKIIKGKIPETLKKVKSNKIAFISIDLNNAYSEIEAMKYFWKRVVKGGIILLDDYAYSTSFNIQRREWDKLSKQLGFKILTLATGQGMIIK
jgi:hypothetical protein